MKRSRPPARRGLTMIELLISLAIFGLVMAGLNAFIFSMGEIWGRGAKERLFRQHTRAITYFLDRTFREATTAAATGVVRESAPRAAAGQEASARTQQPQTRTSTQSTSQNANQSGSASTAERAVRWAKPEGDSFKPFLLTADLIEAPNLIQFPSTPLPHLTIQLELREGKGLWLLWNSKLEKTDDDKPPPPHETLISANVVAFGYDYYDAEAKRWTSEDNPKSGNGGDPVVPDRLRIKFKLGDEEVETSVTIPPALEGNRPIF